jgi:putative transcriptional regulator
MNRAMSATFSASLGCLLLLGACAARAQDLDEPLLLVAKPDLQGPYARTALLVVPLGDKHFGFILNRATGMTLAKLYPEHAPSAKVADPVYLGGPEAPDALFAVTRRDPGRPSLRLFGDLYMTGHAGIIDRIIEQSPSEARYFAGFVGWMPEELAAEIEAGYWYVGEADESLVFRADTSSLWEELVARLGLEAHAQLDCRPQSSSMPTS